MIPLTPTAFAEAAANLYDGVLGADPQLPVASVALVASPFDFSKVPLVAPLRPIAADTRGWSSAATRRPASTST